MKYLDEWLQQQKEDYAVQFVLDNKWTFYVLFDPDDKVNFFEQRIQLFSKDQARAIARNMSSENRAVTRSVKVSKYTPTQDIPFAKYWNAVITEVVSIHIPQE